MNSYDASINRRQQRDMRYIPFAPPQPGYTLGVCNLIKATSDFLTSVRVKHNLPTGSRFECEYLNGMQEALDKLEIKT